MQMIPLKASARGAAAKAKALRRSGQVPCVVYGHKVQMHVQCPAQELHTAFVKARESTLVDLDVDGKKIPVLFKAVDLDPVSDREIHADFYAVNMDEEIETLVPVHFEGEAPAVKTLGGVFVIAHDHVKVRCLPKDLPHSITVSVLGLEEFRSSVSVKDLRHVPAGVQVLEVAETVLATVQEPRKEEEITPVAVAAPAEGEAAAEGAAPASAEATAGKEGAAPAATAEVQAKEKAEKKK